MIINTRRLAVLFASYAKLSLAAPATFFSVSNVVATDLKRPDAGHSISFTVSNPNAVFEQGGNSPAFCSFDWTTLEPPCCFKQCTDNSNYYARISPDAFESAHSFSLDIVEQFSYRNSVRNNATVSLEVGQNGYWCSNGAQSDVCQSTAVYNETFVTEYGIGSLGDVCA